MEKIKKSQFKTLDGSPTLYMEAFDEYYHSKHGAIQEAEYVYLDKGFSFWMSQTPLQKECAIFEMGFGTGLNAVLTAELASREECAVNYTTIEPYPLTQEELKDVGYSNFLIPSLATLFNKTHEVGWEEYQKISDFFTLKKEQVLLNAFLPIQKYDVIFYDAFGARTQPELWEDDCFPALVNMLNPGGVFVTYSAKGSVQRVLDKLGLHVSLIPGPPGKREMIRAVKPLL